MQPRKSLFFIYLVKAGDDFIQGLEAVNTFFQNFRLLIELAETGDGGEHDRDVAVALAVEAASLLVVRQVPFG